MRQSEITQQYIRHFICMMLVCAYLVLPSVASAQTQALTGDNAELDEYEYSADYAYTTEVAGDPYESINRNIFSFNKFFDTLILKPIAKAYRAIVPDVGRKGVGNVLKNVAEPITAVNSLLQGDLKNAASSFWRFTINTTLGFGGIMDVAGEAGLTERREDFGQTLGVYGKDVGAYIVIPFFGPSSTRDVVGRVADAFTNPFTYGVDREVIVTYAAVNAVDSREEVLDLTNEIERTSLDPYAAIRSLYLQSRSDMVRNGAAASDAVGQ